MVTAILPMRGQPPHIGHVLTIVKIYGDYDRIILYVVSEPGKHFRAEDFIMPAEEVVAVLKEVFRYMPKIDVISGKEHLRDKTSFSDLPPFDVIVTGNTEFIKSYRGQKPVRYVPRSKICNVDIDGTKMRSLLRRAKC